MIIIRYSPIREESDENVQDGRRIQFLLRRLILFVFHLADSPVEPVISVARFKSDKMCIRDRPNGQPSENLARVENFYNRWRKAHPEIPIEYLSLIHI